MKLSPHEFRSWDNRRVTLLGMSGVGKTRLAALLRQHDWFHYSADYRIGTRYLDEPILDNIKQQAMQVPFLRDLLRSDSIYISNNITVDNLHPVSSFLGKLGNPEAGGLSLREFERRQALHREAEAAAMRDVPVFIGKAQEIYGYRHFVNDAGGSLCELDEAGLIDCIAECTILLYIQATGDEESALVERSKRNPKPLFYRKEFLDEHLREYMELRGVPYVALIDPDDFTSWIFPRLFAARKPRYEAIAHQYGYTVTSGEIQSVRDETDFLQLVEEALRRDHAAAS